MSFRPSPPPLNYTITNTDPDTCYDVVLRSLTWSGDPHLSLQKGEVKMGANAIAWCSRRFTEASVRLARGETCSGTVGAGSPTVVDVTQYFRVQLSKVPGQPSIVTRGGTTRTHTLDVSLRDGPVALELRARGELAVSPSGVERENNTELPTGDEQS